MVILLLVPRTSLRLSFLHCIILNTHTHICKHQHATVIYIRVHDYNAINPLSHKHDDAEKFDKHCTNRVVTLYNCEYNETKNLRNHVNNCTGWDKTVSSYWFHNNHVKLCINKALFLSEF